MCVEDLPVGEEILWVTRESDLPRALQQVLFGTADGISL